jgi:hypothetical protein
VYEQRHATANLWSMLHAHALALKLVALPWDYQEETYNSALNTLREMVEELGDKTTVVLTSHGGMQ